MDASWWEEVRRRDDENLIMDDNEFEDYFFELFNARMGCMLY